MAHINMANSLKPRDCNLALLKVLQEEKGLQFECEGLGCKEGGMGQLEGQSIATGIE